MKPFFNLLFLLLTTGVFAQVEGQSFCEGTSNGSYLPLNIAFKKIYWYDTFYYEKTIGKKVFNGKEYIQIEQKWENGNIDVLYLREENGAVLEYQKCCNTDALRYTPNKSIDENWYTKEKKINTTVISKNANLKTPFCYYKDLLVLRVAFESGESFDFYYLKGLGYVGATKEGTLVSCITPEK